MECRPKVVPKNKARKRTADPENWKQNVAKKRRSVVTLLRVVHQNNFFTIT